MRGSSEIHDTQHYRVLSIRDERERREHGCSVALVDAGAACLLHRGDRPFPLRAGRGRPRPDAADAARRQAQGDRQGRAPANEQDRRRGRAIRRAAPGHGSRPHVRCDHSASVGHAWLSLRERLESTATAWYLAELAERAVEERAFAYPVYALLRRAYQLLDDGMAPGRVARWFEFGLADALGMRPEVERCVECDRVLDADDEFRWVPTLGGTLCSRHNPPPGGQSTFLSPR